MPLRITPLLLVVSALFITTLITSNIMAVKIFEVNGRLLPAAMVIFPLSYIIGDVLTEVYGYRAARAVIWLGFLCASVAVMAFWAGQLLPAASVWNGQEAYERILGSTPRILGASFTAYLAGEFTNSSILARMKVATNGRWLWTRTISSTIVGQGLDSAIFIFIAFAGILAGSTLVEIILTQWTVKILYEVAATPLTYGVVRYLKRKDEVDHYDVHTSFNPLAVFK